MVYYNCGQEVATIKTQKLPTERKIKMKTYKEIRSISYDDLRDMCISRNYFNIGDSKTYEKFLGGAEDLRNVTITALHHLGRMIINNTSWLDEDDLGDVMFNIVQYCTTEFIPLETP